MKATEEIGCCVAVLAVAWSSCSLARSSRSPVMLVLELNPATAYLPGTKVLAKPH